MSPEKILLEIKNLNLKDALALLAAKKVFDFSKKGYESVRKLLQNKVSKKKFGFVPRKDEGDFLIKVANRRYYQEFGWVLPEHRYADLIRVGYLISHLNKAGGKANRKRVDEIRSSIYQRPNGKILLKIVYLVTTGAIVPVVDYLSDLKRDKFDQEYLANSFDDIIRNWKKYTYFVKSDTKKIEIIEYIKQRMRDKQKLIMVFSYGAAKRNTTLAVAKILKEKIQEDYTYESKNNREGEKEVHSSTFTLMELY